MTANMWRMNYYPKSQLSSYQEGVKTTSVTLTIRMEYTNYPSVFFTEIEAIEVIHLLQSDGHERSTYNCKVSSSIWQNFWQLFYNWMNNNIHFRSTYSDLSFLSHPPGSWFLAYKITSCVWTRFFNPLNFSVYKVYIYF